MNHFISAKFWRHYDALPEAVRPLADKALRLLKEASRTPSLRLKKAGRYWSVRVGKHYRAMAVEIPEGLLWIWVGNHTEYERLLGRRR